MSPEDYPRKLERDVTLKDGTALRLRPIRPEDAPRLIEFYDYRRRLALVAERGPVDAPEIEAVARYGPTDDPEIAEVAFEDNSRMLDLLNRFTDVRDRHLESGVVTLDFERRAGDEIARHG